MTPWYDIYRERMNSLYREHVARKYAPFLKALFEVKHARYTTEIGCGAGNITRLLREMRDEKTYGHRYYHLIDNCPKMLGLAVENNPVDNCKFQVADIVKVSQTSDLIHSHGLLEHFDNLTIQCVVEMGMEASPVQIHYVPGAKYDAPSRGDERLMSPGS